MSSLEQQLFDAIQQLSPTQVEQHIAAGANVNYLDAELGFPLSCLTDSVFQWWDEILQAYEDEAPLSDVEKQAKLMPYLNIFEQLIQAGANPHIWDSEEFYGPLWDVASAGCEPLLQRLLALEVNPNSLDDDGLPILSSISDLWFECEYDQIDWSLAYPEQKIVLQTLREHGAKMRKELPTVAE